MKGLKMEVELLYFGETTKLNKTRDKIKTHKKVYQIKEGKDIIQSFTEEIKKIWREYQKKNLFSIKFYIPQNSPLEMIDERGKTARKKERKVAGQGEKPDTNRPKPNPRPDSKLRVIIK